VKIAHVWPRVFLPTRSPPRLQPDVDHRAVVAASSPSRSLPWRAFAGRAPDTRLLFQRPFDVPPPIWPHACRLLCTLPHDSVFAVGVSIACDTVADGCSVHAHSRAAAGTTLPGAVLEACLTDCRRCPMASGPRKAGEGRLPFTLLSYL
jgi:hypothetical protein